MSAIMDLINREPWAEFGKCLEVPADVFFPESNSQAAKKPAKKACAECPVRAECLDFGIDEKHGVWGGLDEKERWELKRRRAS